MTWQRRSSRVVYDNPWIIVREDEVTRPDGNDGIYGYVEVRHPSVIIVALTQDEDVILIRNDRYTLGRSHLELPAGGTDGGDVLTAAARELREETGYAAADLLHLSATHQLKGIAKAEQHVVLATGAHFLGGAAQEEEGVTSVALYPWSDIIVMLRDGELTDSESAAALMYAAIHLGRVS